MKTSTILFFLNSLTHGGAERQTIDLVNNLDSSEYLVGLIYLDLLDDLSLNVTNENLFCCQCLERQGKFDFRILGKLKNIIKGGNVDIVFCVNEYTFLYAWVCKKIFHLEFRLITAIHHTIIRPGKWEFVKQEIYRRLLNQCDDLVFVCHNQLEYWKHKYGVDVNRSTVIYNGVDVELYNDTYTEEEKNHFRELLGFSCEDFIVGICAVLRPEKRHIDFIDGIMLAHGRGVKLKALIIGNGPEYYKIKHCIDQSVIVMAGFQADVRPYLAISDCLALTSVAVETFSVSALESMAMGKPMVMTNIGGASEQVIHGENGYIFEPGDVATFAEYLERLSDKKHRLQLGNNASAIVRGKFTIKKMTDSYVRLFDRSHENFTC